MTENTPRIYVADLAAYNNGYLHGVWIDATDDLDEITAAVQAMLETSPILGAEEYAIHDYQGFAAIRLHEYASLETAQQMACFIAEHDELGAAVLNHCCGDLDEAREALENNYQGMFDSLADYAEEMTEEMLDLKSLPSAVSRLLYYIDYAAMARDMEMNGDIFTVKLENRKVAVFWSH